MDWCLVGINVFTSYIHRSFIKLIIIIIYYYSKVKSINSCTLCSSGRGEEVPEVFSDCSRKFLEELGRRIRRVSGEVNSTTFLRQRLSIAMQRENAASVLGTIGSTEAM